MTKEIIVGVTISCSFGAIAWIVATLISVDKRTEVIFNFFYEDPSLLKLLSNKTIDKFMRQKLI